MKEGGHWRHKIRYPLENLASRGGAHCLSWGAYDQIEHLVNLIASCSSRSLPWMIYITLILKLLLLILISTANISCEQSDANGRNRQQRLPESNVRRFGTSWIEMLWLRTVVNITFMLLSASEDENRTSQKNASEVLNKINNTGATKIN